MTMYDKDYINHCTIPSQYKCKIERGYYTKDQVINFKNIWGNAPVPRAWVPIEIMEKEMKQMKDDIKASLFAVLKTI